MKRRLAERLHQRAYTVDASATGTARVHCVTCGANTLHRVERRVYRTPWRCGSVLVTDSFVHLCSVCGRQK